MSFSSMLNSFGKGLGKFMESDAGKIVAGNLSGAAAAKIAGPNAGFGLGGFGNMNLNNLQDARFLTQGGAAQNLAAELDAVLPRNAPGKTGPDGQSLGGRDLFGGSFDPLRAALDAYKRNPQNPIAKESFLQAINTPAAYNTIKAYFVDSNDQAGLNRLVQYYQLALGANRFGQLTGKKTEVDSTITFAGEPNTTQIDPNSPTRALGSRPLLSFPAVPSGMERVLNLPAGSMTRTERK